MLKNRNGRGFSLIESGVVMVTLPAVKESRSQMRGVSSSVNLQQIGQSGAVYAFASVPGSDQRAWREDSAGYAFPLDLSRIGRG